MNQTSICEDDNFEEVKGDYQIHGVENSTPSKKQFIKVKMKCKKSLYT